MLLEADAGLFAGGFLGLVIFLGIFYILLGIWPIWIASKKGHDSTHLILVFLITFAFCWLAGLIYALSLEDKSKKPVRRRRPRRPAQPVPMHPQAIQYGQMQQHPMMHGPVPHGYGHPYPAHQQQLPHQQFPMPQPPIQNPHVPFQQPPMQNQHYPTHAPTAPSQPYGQPVPPQMPTPNPTPETSVWPSTASSIPIGSATVSDSTPIVEQNPTVVPTQEVKVRCKACNKKFSGAIDNIAALKSCPKCKASPFDCFSIT